jgi:hypothetical protein
MHGTFYAFGFNPRAAAVRKPTGRVVGDGDRRLIADAIVTVRPQGADVDGGGAAVVLLRESTR